jgi:hypothetical protein
MSNVLRALYNYGNEDTGLLVFPAGGNNWQGPIWRSGKGWAWENILLEFDNPNAVQEPTPQPHPPKPGGCWVTLLVANPDGTTTYEHFWEDPCPYGLNDLTFLDRVQDRLGSGRKATSAIVTIPKPTQ